MTVPNLLSLLRMGLTPLFLVAVVSGRPLQALLVFAFAGVTDALDGFIARTYGQQSRLGAYLDPIADKLLLMSAYVVLAIPGLHPGAIIPAWVTVLVLARDLIIVIVALIFSLALGVKSFRPSWLSKVNTTVQVVTALLVLASGFWQALRPLAEWATYAVAVTTVGSGVDYILRANSMAPPGGDGSDGDAPGGEASGLGPPGGTAAGS
jgi:cardiolipin synthase